MLFGKLQTCHSDVHFRFSPAAASTTSVVDDWRSLNQVRDYGGLQLDRLGEVRVQLDLGEASG